MAALSPVAHPLGEEPEAPGGYEFKPLLDLDHLATLAASYQTLSEDYSAFEFRDDGYEIIVAYRIGALGDTIKIAM
eukprot:6464700-Amphidinium_carterae.1